MEKLALRWASGPSSTKSEGTIELEPERSYRIGSADGCDVRLPDGAPSTAAEISVATRLDRKQQPGLHVTYLPYWDGGGGQMIADHDGRTTVDIGNTMELGGVKLEIVDLSRPAYSRSRDWLVRHVKRYLARAEIARRHLRQYSHDVGLLYGGSRRVGELMKKLGAVVHESEAEEVQSLFDAGHRTSVAVMSAFIVFCCAVLYMGSPAAELSSTLWPILIPAVAVLLTLITSSFFCSVAGTVMIGSAAATTTLLLMSPQDLQVVALFTTLSALLGAAVGYAMEAAWCPVLLDRKSANARIVLSGILGAAALVLLAKVFPALAGSVSDWLLAGCALLLAWTWLGVSWRSRQFMKADDRPRRRGGRITKWWRKRCITRIPSADASLLLSVAWVRWRRQLLARTLAVILVITPVLALLNSLNLEQRLTTSATDAGAASGAKQAAGDAEQPVDGAKQPAGNVEILLWRERTVVMDDKAFEKFTFYYIEEADWLGRAHHIERTGLTAILHDAAGAQDLRVETLDEALAKADSAPDGDFWMLPEAKTGGEEMQRVGLTKNTADGWRHRFKLYVLLKFPTVLLVALAVLILWRASGEGAPAIAVGLWALGYASAMSLDLTDVRFNVFTLFDLRTLQERLSSSSGNLLAELLVVVNAAFSVFAVLWGYLTLFGFATMALVVTWCWPAPLRGPEGGLRLGSIAARAFVVVLVPSATVLLLVTIDALARPLNISVKVSDFVGMGLVTAVPLLAAWQFRRLQRRRHPELVNTGWPHAAVTTLPGLIMLAYIMFVWHFSEYRNTSIALLSVLSLLLLAALFYLVVWRNEWNLAGGRTLSSVIVIIFVPILLKAFEHLVLEHLEHIGLFPRQATTVAAVLLAVFIFPFCHHAIEWVLDLSVLRRLHAVTQKIPAIIERLVTNRDEDQRRAEIRALLDEVGLKRYFFYARQTSEKGEFACQLSTFDDSCAPDIELSDRLLRQLAREHTFLDFNMTMRQVDYTFTASELWRLQRRLGFENIASGGASTAAVLQPRCRYLLPIALGDAVCGLIVAGSQPLPSAVRFEHFVAYLQQLGVAATTGSGRVGEPRALGAVAP